MQAGCTQMDKHTHTKKRERERVSERARDVIPEPAGKYRVGHRSKHIQIYLPTFSVNNTIAMNGSLQ